MSEKSRVARHKPPIPGPVDLTNGFVALAEAFAREESERLSLEPRDADLSNPSIAKRRTIEAQKASTRNLMKNIDGWLLQFSSVMTDQSGPPLLSLIVLLARYYSVEEYYDKFCSEPVVIKLPDKGGEKEEGRLNEPIDIFMEAMNVPREKWSETAAELLRVIMKARAPEKRALWDERENDPELANLSAPKFLKRVWADQISDDGTVVTEDVRQTDSSLMEKVGIYVNNRRNRNRRGDGTIDYGDAEGLRFVARPGGAKRKAEAGAPKNE